MDEQLGKEIQAQKRDLELLESQEKKQNNQSIKRVLEDIAGMMGEAFWDLPERKIN